MTQRDADGKKAFRNDRIIALPIEDKRYDDVKQLEKMMRTELEQFFIVVSSMTHKDVTVEGWDGPKKAERLVEDAAQRYVRGAKRAQG